jgi:2-hydroxychromene-2-carboxylate isomerase
MAAVSETKRAYSQWDHVCWTRWWNAINTQEGKPDKNIDFYWADIFPIRTPTVLRAVLAEPKLDGPLYRACWEKNLDMSNDGVLKQAITDAGYDGDKVLAKANSPEVKAELRACTKQALETGVCGVPTYRVFRRRKGETEWKQHGDLVWGQDEITTVEDYIAGWDGDSIAKIGDEPLSRL